MWQVIVDIDGELHHEGFFDNERSAKAHRDFIAERMWNADVYGEVYVVELFVQNY